MILDDSASVFTAEVWTIIKSLEQIKDLSPSKFIIYTDSRSWMGWTYESVMFFILFSGFLKFW